MRMNTCSMDVDCQLTIRFCLDYFLTVSFKTETYRIAANEEASSLRSRWSE